MITACLRPSYKQDKKYTVTVILEDGTKKTIHFGSAGMSDYTIHKDYERMKRYENRHKAREDWTISGITSAGFWAKWILWNKPDFTESVKSTSKKFHIRIIFSDTE